MYQEGFQFPLIAQHLPDEPFSQFPE
jgi:hypothetical protein